MIFLIMLLMAMLLYSFMLIGNKNQAIEHYHNLAQQYQSKATVNKLLIDYHLDSYKQLEIILARYDTYKDFNDVSRALTIRDCLKKEIKKILAGHNAKVDELYGKLK